MLAVSANAPRAAATVQRHALLRADPRLSAAIVAEVNVIRESRGLRFVRQARGLARSAASHVRAMGKRGFFAHNGPDGTFVRRLERFYSPTGTRFWAVGENLGWAGARLTARTLVRLWLDDAAHRAILLDPRWKQVGVAAIHVAAAPGAYRHRNVTIVAADFGSRVG